jgi:integrase
MANPSYWVFRRNDKWHAGWRDDRGRSHSKVQPLGMGKEYAREYARRRAIEATQIAAGATVVGKPVDEAIAEFSARQDVKECTHRLNERHLRAFVEQFQVRTVEQLTESLMHQWLAVLKARGANPGGQSLSLRVLRTFCRFCRKRSWLAKYPFEDFKIPKPTFVGRYLTADERARLLSLNPRYDVDQHLNRALTFGLYSLLRISQVFAVDWKHFRPPDQLWIPGIKGQAGRWIGLHPKALAVMGPVREDGQVFDRWATVEKFREAVMKKARREGLKGVRFHETKHTGISALLEAGYSIPEVCKISGNSMRTISHYAHVNEQRAFERWKSFDYALSTPALTEKRTAGIQQEPGDVVEKQSPKGTKGQQGEDANRLYFSTNSRPPTDENLSRGGAAW